MLPAFAKTVGAIQRDRSGAAMMSATRKNFGLWLVRSASRRSNCGSPGFHVELVQVVRTRCSDLADISSLRTLCTRDLYQMYMQTKTAAVRASRGRCGELKSRVLAHPAHPRLSGTPRIAPTIFVNFASVPVLKTHIIDFFCHS